MTKYRLTELQLLSISITSSIVIGLVWTGLVRDQNPLLLPGRLLGMYVAHSIAPLLVGAALAALFRMFCQIKYLKLFTYSNFVLSILILLSIFTNTYPQYGRTTFSEPVQSHSLVEKRIEQQIDQHNSKNISDQPPSMTYDEEGYPKILDHYFAMAKYATEQAKKYPTTKHFLQSECKNSRENFIEWVNSEFAQSLHGIYVFAYPVDLKSRRGVGIVVGHYIDKLPPEDMLEKVINRGMQKMRTPLYRAFCPILRVTNFKTHVLYMPAYRNGKEDVVLGSSTFNWSDCKKNMNAWQ